MARCPDRDLGDAPKQTRGNRILLAWVAVLALACDSGQGETQAELGSTPPDDSDLAALQAWLVAGEYLDWVRYDPEPTEGMPGASRVYLSPALAASLAAGATVHPLGSAAVREILDLDQPGVQLGWAYSHKLGDGSGGDGADGGEAWFFYEVFSLEVDGVPLVAERGATGCVGCHQAGVDFVQTRPGPE